MFPMGNMQFQDHNGDNDGDHSVAKGFQSSFFHVTNIGFNELSRNPYFLFGRLEVATRKPWLLKEARLWTRPISKLLKK